MANKVAKNTAMPDMGYATKDNCRLKSMSLCITGLIILVLRPHDKLRGHLGHFDPSSFLPSFRWYALLAPA